jgi:hypothetical protein
LVLAGGIGALPGVGLYLAVAGILKRLAESNNDRIDSIDDVKQME